MAVLTTEQMIPLGTVSPQVKVSAQCCISEAVMNCVPYFKISTQWENENIAL